MSKSTFHRSIIFTLAAFFFSKNLSANQIVTLPNGSMVQLTLAETFFPDSIAAGFELECTVDKNVLVEGHVAVFAGAIGRAKVLKAAVDEDGENVEIIVSATMAQSTDGQMVALRGIPQKIVLEVGENLFSAENESPRTLNGRVAASLKIEVLTAEPLTPVKARPDSSAILDLPNVPNSGTGISATAETALSTENSEISMEGIHLEPISTENENSENSGGELFEIETQQNGGLITVIEGTELALESAQPLNSSTVAIGNTLFFKIKDDVLVEGRPVFKSGARAFCRVIGIEKASRNSLASLTVEATYAESVDGKVVLLTGEHVFEAASPDEDLALPKGQEMKVLTRTEVLVQVD